MFVTNHVLSGVLIGHAMPRRPVAAFFVGVGSHLVLDSVPHWGCDLTSSVEKERFLKIARRDGLLGLATMAIAAMGTDRKTRVATCAAMAGAAVLDLDKPFEHFFGLRPFPDLVTRIHKGIQNESVEGMPREFIYGAMLSLADVVTIAAGRRPRRAET
jgi:hypothetical protein